jgi:hypothetical protein
MNSNFLKKLLAVAVTSLFLVSVGASAQEAPTPPAKCKTDRQCGSGMKCVKGKCVTK